MFDSTTSLGSFFHIALKILVEKFSSVFQEHRGHDFSQ